MIDIIVQSLWPLGCQDAAAANRLDLLFGTTGEELGLDDDRLFWDVPLAQNLVVTLKDEEKFIFWPNNRTRERSSLNAYSIDAVDDRRLALRMVLVLLAGLLRHEGPEFVEVDDGAVVPRGFDVEVAHSNLRSGSRTFLI